MNHPADRRVMVADMNSNIIPDEGNVERVSRSVGGC